MSLARVLVAFLCFITLGIAATHGARADTLRLFYWQAPTIVNPHLSPGTKDLSASRIVYEPLASFDASGELVPFLAAEIPSLANGGVAADGRSVTWTLKEGVKWADGTPFTAADVLFTYLYITNPEIGATSASSYDQVKNVKVIDDHTVRVEFHDVNPAWSQPFVGVKGMIIPRHLFEAFAGANVSEAPSNLLAVGTGPYQVAEFHEEEILLIGEDVVSTVRIVYRPNPHFREPDKPAFSQVELRGGGGDAVIAAQTIQDGLSDFAWNLQVADATLDRMEADSPGKVVDLLGTWVERIMLNFADPNWETESGERANAAHLHPILSDIRVRQAIAAGIDRKMIMDLYGRGGRQTDNPTTAGLISPANPANRSLIQ